LARRPTNILPAMTLLEALNAPRIHSAPGRIGDRMAGVTTRPFRSARAVVSSSMSWDFSMVFKRNVSGPQRAPTILGKLQ
jgi:hypothetical protein